MKKIWKWEVRPWKDRGRVPRPYSKPARQRFAAGDAGGFQIPNSKFSPGAMLVSKFQIPDSKFHKRGFTLLELMIAVAIFAVIAVFAILAWSGYQRTQGLEAASQGLSDLLREAQGNALNRVGDTAWCVRVTNVAGSSSSYAELYASSDCSGAAQRRITFSSTVEFSDPADGQTKNIAFQERSGRRLGGTPMLIVSSGFWTGSEYLVKSARYVGVGGTGCTGGNTAWSCETIGSFPDGAYFPAVAFNASGNPRVVHEEYEVYPPGGLFFARRVGSGGTGCGTASAAWSCDVIDSPARFGTLTFSSVGQAWAAYRSPSALRVAREVGTGGTGCTSSAWTCTTVDEPVNLLSSHHPSLAFDFSGLAWIAHQGDTAASIKVARESPGTPAQGGCASGWTCETLAGGANYTHYSPSIAIDATGTPWVAFQYRPGDGKLKIARYVGSGGTGCTSSAWTCTTVDDPINIVGAHPSLIFDSGGTAWIGYRDIMAGALKVAREVGSGGTGCDGSTAWTCTTIDDPVSDVGDFPDLALDVVGNPWIAYLDLTVSALKVARYMPGAGSGCVTASPDWSCEVVETTGASAPSIARNPFEEIAFFLSANPTSSRTLKIGEEGGIVVQ